MSKIQDSDFRMRLTKSIKDHFGAKTKVRFNKASVTVTLDTSEIFRSMIANFTQQDLQLELATWLVSEGGRAVEDIGHCVAISSTRFYVYVYSTKTLESEPLELPAFDTPPPFLDDLPEEDEEEVPQEDPVHVLMRLRIVIETEDFVRSNLAHIYKNILPYVVDLGARELGDVLRFAYLSGMFATVSAKDQQAVADVFNDTFKKYADAIRGNEEK